MSPSISSSRFGGFGGCRSTSIAPPSTRRGGEEVGGFDASSCGLLDLCKGRGEASLGSTSTAALRSLSSQMVERRPLPPLSVASVSSSRRLKALINLRAAMPRRRPLCSSTACSRCTVPSGEVPGDDVVGRAVVLRRGDKGAGPDCVLHVRSGVLCAKRRDLCVIYYLYLVLHVICISTVDFNE